MSTGRPKSQLIERFKNGYSALAVILLNALVLASLVNGTAAGILWLLPADWEAEVSRFVRDHRSFLTRAYPQLSLDEVRQLLEESWSRPFQFEPFTLFREPEFSGQYVNVSPAGFRYSKDQGLWPPRPDDFRVFVFGGSTTFGYGLPDRQTIASYLQDELKQSRLSRARIYNFSHGYYYSTQERIAFENLLQKGHRPELVLFIDGLNEFRNSHDLPYFSNRFSRMFRPARRFFYPERLAVFGLWNRLSGGGIVYSKFEDFEDSESDRQAVEAVIRNYRANKQLIEATARQFGIQAVFVWHPCPAYGSRGADYPFESQLGKYKFPEQGYLAVAQLHQVGDFGPNFFWAADVEAPEGSVLYADPIHFTAAMNRLLARRIARELALRGYIPGLTQQ